MVDRVVDEYGRILYDESAIVGFRFALRDTSDILAAKSDRIDFYNLLCAAWDKHGIALMQAPELDHTPNEEHARRQSDWLIPEQYRTADVRAYVIGLCSTPEEVARVEEEMALYEAYDLLPVLRVMMFLIAHFRAVGAVWGCGRGSSVASFVLYKIGVHKVDSFKYKLDITDFLRP